MKRALFIDRDGTLVIEPPVDYQLDSLEKLTFYPKVFRNLYFIRKNLDFELVMVTNQDGLGTAAFPEETFWPAHNKLLQALEGEGIRFDDILADALELGPLRSPTFLLPPDLKQRLVDSFPSVKPEVLLTLLGYYVENRPEDSPWVVLPVSNFDA